jgi:hypothetical protein
VAKGWADQPNVFTEEDDPGAKMDFLKERVGIEVGFTHSSFIGIDLLKFQVSSYSALDQIDVGIYVVTTRSFQKHLAHAQADMGRKSYLREGRPIPSALQKRDPSPDLRSWP